MKIGPMRLLFRWLSCAFLLTGLQAPLAWGKDTLHVLAWPGYAETEIVQSFEAATQSKVLVTYIDSDAELWSKISQGQAYDVFAVNTAELQRYIGQGLVTPVNHALLPNLARQQARFHRPDQLPQLYRQGKPYAVAYTYAEMGLIYDRRQIPSPPRSVNALWDKRYQGKVLAYDGGTHNFSLAAQALGYDSPFRIPEQGWLAAVEQLIGLRRNVAAFYTQPDEAVTLFKRHGAALMFANYGTQQVKLLQKAGLDVGYTIPTEGALAWLDCWAIPTQAKQPLLAHAWINHMLDAQASEALVKHQGLANTTSSPATSPSARLIWLEPVESEERRNLLWQRILSGDRASKVLGK